MTRTDKTTRVLAIVILTMTIVAPLAMAMVTNSSREQATTTLLSQQPRTARDEVPPVTQKWPYGTDYPVETSPVVADVEGDGKIEVLVAYDWSLDAVNGSTGDWVRSYSISGEGPSFGNPVIADLYGDGRLQVLITAYGDVYSFNGTGVENWRTHLGSVTGSPAVGDVDGDGKPELVIGTGEYYGFFYCFNGTGDQEWYYPYGMEGSGAPSSPAIADINGDGKLEVLIVRSNMTGSYFLNCLNGKADIGGNVNSLWQFNLTETSPSFSSPAAADIDNDGHMEVVVGSYDNKTYCISDTGALRWSYMTGAHIDSSPTIADIDGDGRKEILIGSEDSKTYCLDSVGKLKWSYATGGPIWSSPGIADVDGDRQLEVLVGSDDCDLYCLDRNGGLEWSYPTGGMIRSSPVIADIDGDDRLEVVFGSNDATLYCLAVTSAPIAPSAYPWPSIGYREDIRHTGLFVDSDHDGLTDNYEIIVRTNPHSADTDNDGLTDYQEFLRSSNPLVKDWLSNPPIELIPGPGNNASMPSGTFRQYGFTMVTTNATNVIVSSGSSLPLGVGAPPSGSTSFLYLDITGTQMNGTAGTAIYVYYNRSLVPPGVDEKTMQLNRWNSSTSRWVAIPSTVTVLNATHGVITAHLNHFSYFAVFGSSVSGSPTTLLIIAGGAGGAILVVLAILAVKKRHRVTIVRKKKARVVRKRRK